jgi:hypothetical protein
MVSSFEETTFTAGGWVGRDKPLQHERKYNTNAPKISRDAQFVYFDGS